MAGPQNVRVINSEKNPVNVKQQDTDTKRPSLTETIVTAELSTIQEYLEDSLATILGPVFIGKKTDQANSFISNAISEKKKGIIGAANNLNALHKMFKDSLNTKIENIWAFTADIKDDLSIIKDIMEPLGELPDLSVILDKEKGIPKIVEILNSKNGGKNNANDVIAKALNNNAAALIKVNADTAIRNSLEIIFNGLTPETIDKIADLAQPIKGGETKASALMGLSNIIQTLNIIAKNFDPDKVEEAIVSLNKFFDKKNTKSSFQSLFKNIDEAFKGVGKRLTDKTAAAEKVLMKMMGIVTVVDRVNVSLFKQTIKSIGGMIGLALIKTMLKKFYNPKKPKEGLLGLISSFPALKKISNNLENLASIVKSMSIISSSLAAIAITGLPAKLGLKLIKGLLKSMSQLIITINQELKVDEVKNVTDQLNSLAKVVAVSAGIIMIAGFVGGYAVKHWKEILGFTALLAAFIFAVIGAFNLASKGMSDAMKYAGEFNKLLITSAICMMIGGMILQLDPMLAIYAIAFGVVLGIFIFVVVTAYRLGAKELQEQMQTAKSLALLIAVSAGCLLIGALFLKIDPMFALYAIIFAVILAGFIFLVTLAYKMNMENITTSLDTAKGLAILIGVSAFCLLLGALVFYIDPMLAVWTLVFAIILAEFIYGVTFAYMENMANVTTALTVAIGLAILIAVSAGALLIGGKCIADNEDMWWAVPEFAVVLGLFIWGVTAAYVANMANITLSLPAAAALALVVAISAGALLVGGKFICDDKNMVWAVPVFGVILVGFVTIMGVVVAALSILSGEMTMGLLVMAGIGVITFGMGYAFKSLAAGFDAFGGWDDALIKLGIFEGAVAVFAAILGVIGIPTLALAIGIGEVVVAGMVNIIMGFSQALMTLAIALIIIDKAPPIDPEKPKEIVEGIMGMLDAFDALDSGHQLNTIWQVSNLASTLGMCISKLANAVASYASLEIPLYDENGKEIGKRHLQVQDFEDAANSVEKIITTLGGAIIDIYKKRQDMFGHQNTKGLMGILLGADLSSLTPTPFTQVVISCTGMGNMISTIAKSVADVAALTIDDFDPETGQLNGKKRVLKYEDFLHAAMNVKEIVTTLGGAIIDTYTKNKSMFWGWDNEDTPFTITTKACTGMGAMISGIVAGIQDLANLNYAVKWDDKGNVTERKHFDETDFLLAAINADLIITCLGNAVISTYMKHPEMFGDGGYARLDMPDGSKRVVHMPSGQFKKIVEAITGVGEIVSGMAKGIQDVMDLKYATGYNADGTATGYDKLDINDLKQGGKVYQAIEAVVLCLPGALESVLNSPLMNKSTGLLTFDSGENSVMQKVITSFNGIKEMIESITGAVSSILGLTYTDQTGQKRSILCLITDKDGDVTDKLKQVVKAVLSSVTDTIEDLTINIKGDLNKIFKDTKKLDKIKEAFGKFKEIMQTVTSSYTDVIETFQKLFPDGYDAESSSGIFAFVTGAVSNIQEIFPMINSLDVLDEKGSGETFINKMNLLGQFGTNIKNLNAGLDTVKPKTLTNFQKEGEEIGKFIKKVNTIDVKKAQSLKDLINSMNNLSKANGGMDNLANAITQKLSVVLDKLSKELTKAQTTITKTDKLQAEREKRITNSIKEVKKIMQESLTVQIVQDGTNAEGGGAAGSDGSPTDASSLGGTPTPPGEKPTGGKKNEKKTSNGSGYDPMLSKNDVKNYEKQKKDHKEWANAKLAKIINPVSGESWTRYIIIQS